ncbi:hypothetical protein [Rudaeicoccus suwonensis]|uniref:Prenyltransferase/squalene oxidase-like repeat protein n=1 Tax=Rudaeicoccus suwonensis TaxID=657409 RepID=A0A561E8C5_9MICO|nr:hypothetical protein [Rudaeicoccus suwonensis]TWE11863.1 hypothetical protein BKA23_0656 [Rudaeicoccus suwonensis]
MTPQMPDETMRWLLAGDPSIRWQTLADLTDASPQEVAEARSEVAESGWGKDLLDRQSGGRWADGGCFPARDWHPTVPITGDPDGQPWVATLPTLRLLRAFGIAPDHPRVRAAIEAVAEHCTWEYDDAPFFDGEVEPCINGGALSVGAYFRRDMDALATRLVGEQLPDGGWNCEAERGSTRSSFHTTICVLEGLLDYECNGGEVSVAEARRGGEDYLLSRALFRRASTGEPADDSWLKFSFPTQWHYDVLRGADYFRGTGAAPDPRLGEALDLVRAKQQPDGSWLLENTHPGLAWFALDTGDGAPSRWNTLRALRVLSWADGGA